MATAALLMLLALSAADVGGELKKCSAIVDNLERLTCYDRLAKQADASGTAGTTAPATAAPQSLRSTPAPRSAPVTSSRCQAITKKGTQCSRNAQPGRQYCWQHP